MKMGLFHDIGESVIGDIPTFIGFQEGKERAHKSSRGLKSC